MTEDGERARVSFEKPGTDIKAVKWGNLRARRRRKKHILQYTKQELRRLGWDGQQYMSHSQRRFAPYSPIPKQHELGKPQTLYSGVL